MSISVEAINLGKVVQLVANNEGWRRVDTRYRLDKSTYIGGNPEATFNQSPKQLLEPYKEAWLTTQKLRPTDYNRSKVAIRVLAVTDGILSTEGVTTDYYTLWGLPKTEATKPLFAEHEKSVVVNRVSSPNALYIAELPWGACTHNTLLDKNGDVLMMVRSQSQGFNAGRVSVTEEEQTEVEDLSTFATATRSFAEELGLSVEERAIRLLGVAMEKGAAYPAFAFVTQTDVLAKDITQKWRELDSTENTALFSVPIAQVGKWTATDEVGPDIWGQYLLAGGISPDAKLKLHATSAWRIGLAKEYASAAS